MKHRIDSSTLTIDAGINLVAYSPQKKKAFTIQFKTNEKPKPGGGKGALSIDWRLREDSPADLVAVAFLDTEEVWLFTHKEFTKVAQQRSQRGIIHFYLYLSDDVRTKKKAHKSQFKKFLLENRMGKLL